MRNHLLAKFSSARHLLVIALLAGLSVAAGAEDSKRTIGDWQLVCEEAACRMRQGLSNPEQPGVVFGSEIHFEAGGSQPVLNLSFPLGIYLPRGIGLQAGDQRRDAPVSVCLPDGCKAIVLIDAELQNAFSREKAYSVRVYIGEEQPVELEFSLAGYRIAYKDMAAAR